MSSRTILLVLVALMFAGATAFFVRDRMNFTAPAQVAQQAPEPPKPVKKVLVAAAELPTGLILKEENLRWQSWPDENLDAAYIPEEGTDLTKFYGAVVKRGIAAGQPITEQQIVHPGDRGFLAAVLKPGMRALAIAVNPTTGVAGLIFPGDRVDVLFAEVVKPGPNAGEGAVDRHATETVLENARVLALNQSMASVDGQPIAANVATLEVTPKQAEMLTLVTQVGVLSLSLRSLATEDELPVAAQDSVATVARSAGTATAAAAGAAATADATAAPAADATATAGTAAAGAATAPRVWADDAAPDRGQTYTMDTDVSRVLQQASSFSSQGVVVNRGNTAQKVIFQ